MILPLPFSMKLCTQIGSCNLQCIALEELHRALFIGATAMRRLKSIVEKQAGKITYNHRFRCFIRLYAIEQIGIRRIAVMLKARSHR